MCFKDKSPVNFSRKDAKTQSLGCNPQFPLRSLRLCVIIISIIPVVLSIISCESGGEPHTADVIKSDRASSAKPEPADTVSLLRLISELLEQDDYEDALVCFDRIKIEDADTVTIKLLKASTLISAGKSGEARAIVDDILKNDPGHVPALLVLSSIEESQNRNREQRAVLEQVLVIEPENVPALVSMGKLLIRNSASRLAGPYFDRALAVDSGNGEALLGRAWVYRNARDPKKAEALLDRAVELYPDWAMAWQERGRLLKSVGFYPAALTDLDKARALDPDNYFIACDRGDALKNLNRKTEALAEYQRAIALNPDYFMAYVFSSNLKDELLDYDGAYKDYETLARLNPEYYFAFEGLGMHLMRQSRWLEAKDAFMEAYRRALLMDSSGPDLGTYALLASVNALRGGNRQAAQPFINEAMGKITRDSLEHRMLRLYRDWTGDMDISNRIDQEKNLVVKSRMLFYLACFYDIRGNKNLANKLFLQVRDLEVKDMIEWRLNEWALDTRGLAL